VINHASDKAKAEAQKSSARERDEFLDLKQALEQCLAKALGESLPALRFSNQADHLGNHTSLSVKRFPNWQASSFPQLTLIQAITGFDRWSLSVIAMFRQLTGRSVFAVVSWREARIVQRPSAMGYPLPIAVYAYLAFPLLIIGALVCLVAIPRPSLMLLLEAPAMRRSWVSKKRAVGLFLLAFAVLIHGVFITGAATFGPKSVMRVQIFGFHCAYKQPCDIATISTNSGYLDHIRLPQPVDMDTFY
jgi:hypothetical protein